MKISRMLSASVLAGAVLFSGTACSMLNNEKEDSNPSIAAQPTDKKPAESATPSEAPTVKTTSVVEEQEAAARTVNDYYSYVSDPSNEAAIEAAGAPLSGRGGTASAEELKQLTEALPLGFQYFDTSTPDLIKNAYVQLIIGSSIMSKGTMEANVPASAVTINGDTATVDSTDIEIKLNGEKVPMESASSQILKLKKADSGYWVMIAEEITGFQGSVDGSDTAPTEEDTTK